MQMFRRKYLKLAVVTHGAYAFGVNFMILDQRTQHAQTLLRQGMTNVQTSKLVTHGLISENIVDVICGVETASCCL